MNDEFSPRRPASFSFIITIHHSPTVAVYVDNLTDWGWRHGLSCHLIGDSVAELLEFAISMGMRPEWFQPKSSPHFDLTADGRVAAVRTGAIELNRREFVAKLRELRQERLEKAARV